MEIVERISGLDFRDYLRSKVLDPMGLCDFYVGVPESIQARLHFADIVTIPPPKTGEGMMASWNSPAVRALGVPAGGGQVSASDLALLYQPLVNGGKVFGGGQICQPETIRMGTTCLTDDRHRQNMTPDGSIFVHKLRGVVMELAGDDGDSEMQKPRACRGLSVVSFPTQSVARFCTQNSIRAQLILVCAPLCSVTFPTEAEMDADVMDALKQHAGKTYPKKVWRQGGFGSKVSGGAFGHDGAGGQIAWADPATGISLAFVHNTFGPHANPGRVARDMQISDLAAVCTTDYAAKL